MNTFFYSIGSGPSIDEESGTITGVSLIKAGDAEGHFDKKGRQEIVDETTMKQVYEYCKKVESIKVKADHGSGVLSTIGWMDNFSLTADKVLGDFHLYDTEPQKPRIFEIARKNPDHMGMSLEFEGADDVRGDKCYSRCERVLAVALVSDPAANKSLFSTKPETKKMDEDTEDKKPTSDERLDELSKKFEDLTNKFAKKFGEETDDDAAKDGDDNDDKDSKELDDEPDEDDSKKVELQAERIAEKMFKKFAATMGVTTLGKAGAAPDSKVTEKHFEEHVADLASSKFDGDSQKARVHILTNFGKNPEWKKSYEATRLVKTA